MTKGNYEVEVLVNGTPVKEYFKDGSVYIEGRKKAKFSIRIRNNSSSRKLFVPTVDGLSVMNGEHGGFDSSGYIVNAHSSITIDGWRTSDKDVAQFYFTNPGDSYAEKTDKGGNLGVIGCAVFCEKIQPITFTYASGNGTGIFPANPLYDPFNNEKYPRWYAGSSTTTANCLNASATSANFYSERSERTIELSSLKAQDIGTGFGESKKSEVISVSFDRESNPDQVFTVYYNTREQLEKQGIDFNSRPQYITPSAFPAQYCKPPKR